MKKIEIGYTVEKERWLEAADNLYELGQIMARNLQKMNRDGRGQEDADGAPADEEAVYTGDDYFASARLTRQQARDNAISLLQEAADQPGADTAVANEASEGIAVLAGYTMAEAQIENLVTAKGYADCVAFMGEDGISVVVSTDTGELTDTDVAKVVDIAVSESGYPASAVKVMAAN